MTECINKLDDFTYRTKEGITVQERAEFTNKALEVAIEPGKATLSQWEQIGNAMKLAKEKGLSLKFNLKVTWQR